MLFNFDIFCKNNVLCKLFGYFDCLSTIFLSSNNFQINKNCYIKISSEKNLLYKIFSYQTFKLKIVIKKVY